MSKRALLIGINYRGTDSELHGCINDVTNMSIELQKRGYLKENITILTDDSYIKPTRVNILKTLLDLILSDFPELFFHYSGHGSYVQDIDGDEDDGNDECLVPIDYKASGMVIDDEIRGILMCLRENQRLFCVLDCCHSGTGVDLKYNLYKTFIGSTFKMVNDSKQRPTRGECIMLSGCQDNETSADSFIKGKSQGALTATFLQVLPQVKTYQELMTALRKALKDGGYDQLPNLSSGKSLSLKSQVIF